MKKTACSRKIIILALILSALSAYISARAQDQPGVKRKIVVIGDTQHIGKMESLYWDYWGEHNEARTRSLFQEIARREPGCIIHLGDLTRDGSKKSAWKEFDTDSRPVRDRQIPIFPVFGNHEYFGNENEMYRHYYKRFGIVKYRKWYSTVYDGIGLIFINSNFGELSKQEIRQQKAWYSDELNKMETDNSVKRIIVAGHHPPFTNSTIVGPNSIVESDYANPFIRSKKGIFFFSGHCHSYERFCREGKYFIVSGGGGGPRQKLQTDKTKRHYDDQYKGPSVRFFHFGEISQTQDSLYFSAVRLNDNGTFSEADRISVHK